MTRSSSRTCPTRNDPMTDSSGECHGSQQADREEISFGADHLLRKLLACPFSASSSISPSSYHPCTPPIHPSQPSRSCTACTLPGCSTSTTTGPGGWGEGLAWATGFQQGGSSRAMCGRRSTGRSSTRRAGSRRTLLFGTRRSGRPRSMVRQRGTRRMRRCPRMSAFAPRADKRDRAFLLMRFSFRSLRIVQTLTEKPDALLNVVESFFLCADFSLDAEGPAIT